MKHTDRIVHLMRTNPGADITSMVEEDASTLTAKVVSTTRIPLIRAAVIEFVRTVHNASAQVVRREHVRRTKAELDAAQSRALLDAANRRLLRVAALFRELESAPSGADEIPGLIEEITRLLRPVTASEVAKLLRPEKTGPAT